MASPEELAGFWRFHRAFNDAMDKEEIRVKAKGKAKMAKAPKPGSRKGAAAPMGKVPPIAGKRKGY